MPPHGGRRRQRERDRIDQFRRQLHRGTNAAARNVISSANTPRYQSAPAARRSRATTSASTPGHRRSFQFCHGISINNGSATIISNIIAGFTGIYIGGNRLWVVRLPSSNATSSARTSPA